MPLFNSDITSLKLSQPEVSEKRSGILENPSVSLSSPAIFQWLLDSNPTAAGELINQTTALQISTVYTCIRIITESVSSLPLRLYEVNPKGRVEAFDTPLHDLLSIEPNPEMSAVTFWESFTGGMCVDGNGYAQIQRNRIGDPTGIYPLHPNKTQPERMSDGSIAYRTSDGEKDGQTRIIPAADVLHCPLFSFDGLRGLSPINQARQSLGLTAAAEKFGSRWFGNGGSPKALLMPDFNPDEKTAKAIKDSFTASTGGNKQNGIQVIPGNWKYQQISISPEESQFLITRQFQRAEIAALYRIDPHSVGDTTRMSNTNSEQEGIKFVTQTLRPYLSRIEAEITRKFLKNPRNGKTYVVQFDLTEMLRGDFATTMQGYQIGVSGGWINRNEVRREMGENPGGPELDVYLVPVNYQNAENLLYVSEPEPVQQNKANPDVPTPAERNMIGAYKTAFFSGFRDAVGRVTNRADDKRDIGTLTTIFQPILESIFELNLDNVRSRMGVDNFSPDKTVIDEHLRKMSERSQSWKPEDNDSIAATELLKAVRALTYSTHRKAGEHIASQILEETEDE